MNTSKSYLTHIGTATPAHQFSQQEIMNYFSQYANLSSDAEEKLKKIYQNTAIDRRHFCINFGENTEKYYAEALSISPRMQLFEQHASRLGIEAIENSGISQDTLETITHIITVSCTGMYAPGIDIEIIKACNIPTNVARTCIYFMGCAAMINALKAADVICRAQPSARVLIVGVELCSLHFQMHNHADQMVANALFADGAACALVQGQPCHGKNLLLEKFYSELLANSTQHMAWAIRDDGFMIKLSAFIPALLSLGIKNLIQPIMAAYAMNLAEIDYFAIHPGGPKILEKIEEILKLPSASNAAAYEILRNYGNMSSVTILFILQKLLQTIPQGNHDKTILGMAFGPGLAVESALFRLVDKRESDKN